ncbi:uncharacterized protein PADG_07713 [Paracoccidioides brasiliensis Pb18]|uniref:Uncharacterized protein n=1 Tax=Paracoccidioides brasiliensis (strain Pb18) TaxID=502780 RepID=C1GKC7_PARBD|nr:uncharacterized protein PADG_07713 [Paracoccidioides brasiliensis Pb18]EEH42894.2 hypothetical protein PADG_07713 [Paracoccidioides brasiliensis Pb18]
MRVEELLNGGWMKWKLDKLCKKEKSGDDDGRGGGGGGGGGRCVICVLWREVEVEMRPKSLNTIKSKKEEGGNTRINMAPIMHASCNLASDRPDPEYSIRRGREKSGKGLGGVVLLKVEKSSRKTILEN